EHEVGVGGLEPDTLYYFQVVAADDRGQEQSSAVISVRTQAEAPPLPIWAITGLEGSATSRLATIRWQTPEYATTGRVLYGTSAGNLTRSLRAALPVWEHEVGVGGLEPDTLYYFQVVAADDRGQEQSSAVISVRTQAE